MQRLSSIVECFHEFAATEHEGVGHMPEGSQIDIGPTGLDDLGKTPIQHRILLLGLLMDDLAVNGEFGAALGKHHLARAG